MNFVGFWVTSCEFGPPKAASYRIHAIVARKFMIIIIQSFFTDIPEKIVAIKKLMEYDLRDYE